MPRPPRLSRQRALALVILLVGAGRATAQTPPGQAAAYAGNITNRSALLGDPGGLRGTLDAGGITFGLSEVSEILGNVTGGVHRGAAYDGLTTLSLGVDTARALGWNGGLFNVSALQIHGRDLSADDLHNYQLPSGVEANRSTRLWELWLQQAFFQGRLDIKIGQQSIDQEYQISGSASLFVNSGLGWPVLPSTDLYAGGPTYPLAALGIRVRAQNLGPLSILAGVFDDNPPGGPFYDDSQVRGASQSGTRFNLGTGALFMTELQFALNPPPADPKATPVGLPGTYKIGAWFDSGHFPDQRLGTDGLSLANPASNGSAIMRYGDDSFYVVADQMVWRPAAEGATALSVFARAIVAPQDRNLIAISVKAGVTVKAPFPGRASDAVGLGFGSAKLGNRAIALARDAAAYGAYSPTPNTESFLELTYQAQITPAITAQPDFQYVFMPSGGLANPLVPGRRVGNEAIIGARVTVNF